MFFLILVQEKADMLVCLDELEIASKILLGSMHRKKEVNPLDYCYKVKRSTAYRINEWFRP